MVLNFKEAAESTVSNQTKPHSEFTAASLVFWLQPDMRASADIHAKVTTLCSVMLSLAHSRSSSYLNHEMSPLVPFVDDEEEELSETETPKVKKKKKAKKSKESKGSKRRSRREVRMQVIVCVFLDAELYEKYQKIIKLEQNKSDTLHEASHSVKSTTVCRIVNLLVQAKQLIKSNLRRSRYDCKRRTDLVW